MGIKILVVSDEVVSALYSPGVCEIAQGVDLILSCGDLPSAYLEYLVTQLNVPLYYVMGNHAGAGGAGEFPEGAMNLDGQVVDFHGCLIAGLQGSMRYNDKPRYQYRENEMWLKVLWLAPRLLWNKVRYGRALDILVTHAPPFGIQDGQDRAHMGFRSFVWLIDRFRPDYLFHGHVHIFDRRMVRQTLRGVTLVINAYGYKIVEYSRRPTR